MILEGNSAKGLMIIIQGLSHMLQQSHIDVSFSRSTLVILVIMYVQNNKIYCANSGDSRAILLNRDEKWKIKQLSRDHKSSCKDEADRILAKGKIDPLMNGLDLFLGPVRVETNKNVPGLAMTRSLGDEQHIQQEFVINLKFYNLIQKEMMIKQSIVSLLIMIHLFQLMAKVGCKNLLNN